jgi:hypothetical protein
MERLLVAQRDGQRVVDGEQAPLARGLDEQAQLGDLSQLRRLPVVSSSLQELNLSGQILSGDQVGP